MWVSGRMCCLIHERSWILSPTLKTKVMEKLANGLQTQVRENTSGYYEIVKNGLKNELILLITNGDDVRLMLHTPLGLMVF